MSDYSPEMSELTIDLGSIIIFLMKMVHHNTADENLEFRLMVDKLLVDYSTHSCEHQCPPRVLVIVNVLMAKIMEENTAEEIVLKVQHLLKMRERYNDDFLLAMFIISHAINIEETKKANAETFTDCPDCERCKFRKKMYGLAIDSITNLRSYFKEVKEIEILHR